MAIHLYDLRGSDETVRFSPYCWRTKMALKHKGVDFDTVPWRFTEKDNIAMSGQGRVPVIVHDGTPVADSWDIATYLDTTFPDRPALMKDAAARASAKMIQTWTQAHIMGCLVPIAIQHVHDNLDEKDATYFRETREAALKKTIEEAGSEAASADGEKRLAQTLKLIEPTLTDHAFLGGDDPFYGDHIVFGTLMWPRIVNGQFALDGDTAVAAWFERMLDLHDGYARTAKRFS